jgi:hypothetical protein
VHAIPIGSDDEKAKRREMFLETSLGLCLSSDVDLMTRATTYLFKQLGPQLPLASAGEDPWRVIGEP